MNSIQVRPARGAALRAAVGAAEITAASSAAHWLAGGLLPSACWVLASALPIFGIGILVHRGRLSLPAAFVAAGVGQTFMHLVLAQAGPAGHVHAGGSDPQSALPMVVAHVVGALATVLLWSSRRRVWDVLVWVGRVRAVVLRRTSSALAVRVDRVDALLLWMGSRRRGPPLWVTS